MIFQRSLRRHYPDQVIGSKADCLPLSLVNEAPRAFVNPTMSINVDNLTVK